MNRHSKSGRAMAPHHPKLSTLRKSLSAPVIVGTETESRTCSDLGPTKKRALDSPGRPAATPRTSAGLVSLGLLGSVTMSMALCSVTTSRLSGLSGINTAPKKALLVPTQSYLPCSVLPLEIFLAASCLVLLSCLH